MYKNIYGAIWIGASQMVLLVVNLLLLKVLTQELAVSDYGFYALCLTIVLFVRQIIYDPFSMVIAKEASMNSTHGEKSFIELLVVKYAVDRFSLSIIITAFLLFFVGYLFWGVSNYTVALLICSLYLLANGAQGVYINIFNATRKRKVAALLLMVDSLIKFLMVISFLHFFGNDANNVLSSIAIGAITSFFVMRLYMGNKIIKIKISTAKIKNLHSKYLLLSIPILLPTILNALRSVGDRWVLTVLIGLDELAAYSVLLQIGYLPIILIIGVFQTYIGPSIYELCESKDAENLKKFLIKIISMTIVVSLFSGFFAYIFSEIIFKIFVSQKYNPYSVFLPVFAFAASISAGAAIMQNIVFGYFDTRISSAVILFANMAGILIALILTYFFNFVGAALGLGVMALTSFLVFSSIMIAKLFAPTALDA